MGAFSLGLSARLVMRFGIRRPLGVGLGLASIGLLLFVRAPVDGNFLTDVLPSMILLGFGAGMAFNPLLLAAMNDADPSEAGLASGVVNTAFMMGGALGLAILASVAASRTDSLRAAGEGPLDALTGGYHLAFLVGAIFAIAAATIGATLLRETVVAPPPGAEPRAGRGVRGRSVDRAQERGDDASGDASSRMRRSPAAPACRVAEARCARRRRAPRRRPAPRAPSGPTSSGSAPIAVATTGTPSAIASAAARPKVSADARGHDRQRGASAQVGELFRRHPAHEARPAGGAQRRRPAGRRRPPRAAGPPARTPAPRARRPSPAPGARRRGRARRPPPASARRRRARRGARRARAPDRAARAARAGAAPRSARARRPRRPGPRADAATAPARRRRRRPRRRCRGSSGARPAACCARGSACSPRPRLLKHVPTAQTRR